MFGCRLYCRSPAPAEFIKSLYLLSKSFILPIIASPRIYIRFLILDSRGLDNRIELHVDLQSNSLDEVYVVDENVGHDLAPSEILDNRTR